MPKHQDATAAKGLAALEAAHAAFSGADSIEIEAVGAAAIKEARAILATAGMVTLDTTQATASITKASQSEPYSTPTLSLTAS